MTGTKSVQARPDGMTMPLRTGAALALIALLCACHPARRDTANQTRSEPPPPASPAPAASPPAPGPSPAPSPAVDPKSPEAAVAVARSYYALIAAKRFDKAAALVSPPPPAGALAARFGGFSALSPTLGPAGDSEGAAGSIYITVPARITARRPNGAQTILPEIVTLRRVNDVPGSTEAQRRWHITAVAPAGEKDHAQ